MYVFKGIKGGPWVIFQVGVGYISAILVAYKNWQGSRGHDVIIHSTFGFNILGVSDLKWVKLRQNVVPAFAYSHVDITHHIST